MNERIENYCGKLARMINCETISSAQTDDMSKFDRFHDLLKELFPTVYAKCEVEEFDSSLLIRWPGENHKKAVCYMNHHDVVEANGAWSTPPFEATIVDGKMYGRGTLDTKGGLFAMLEAAEELLQEGFVPALDIYFESACNEETTGLGCAQIVEVLKQRGVRFEYLIDEGGMIVDEPLAGVKGTYAMIGLSERGHNLLRFTANSKGGHASTPPQNTPLVRLGQFMAYADRHQIFDVQISDAVVQMLQSFSKSMSGPLAFVYRHADWFRGLLKYVMPKTSPTAKAMTQTTLAFTMAKGSDQPNVLPQSAYVMGDMRTSIHQGSASSLAAIEKVARKFDITMEVVEQGTDSNMADLQGEAFRLAKEVVEEVYPGVQCAPYIMNQCSDARSMTPICDNCLRFTPLWITNDQMKTIHGIDENVNIRDLDKAVDFYKAMMRRSK